MLSVGQTLMSKEALSGALEVPAQGPAAGVRPPLRGRGICLPGSLLLQWQGVGDTADPKTGVFPVRGNRGGGVLLQVWSPGFWSLLRLAPGPPPLGAAPPHPSGPGLQYRPRPAEALRGGASAFPQQSGRRARRRRLRPLPCPLPGPWGLRAAAWDSRAGGCGCSRRPPQRPRRRHGPRGLAASARSGRPPNARGRASPPRVPASWASQSRR